MKKLCYIFLGLSQLLLGACRKDFEVIDRVPVVFQLVFPDNFKEEAKPEKVHVQLKNNITGEINELLSDQDGKVAIPLIPGTYSLSASRSYTVQESEALTGHAEESFVNASLAPLLVDAGTSLLQVPLKGSKAGSLLIREFYYSGSPKNYFYDLFVEVYNNSNETVYLDSMYMGNTKTASAAAYGFITDTESVYLAQVWMVPGSGTEHPLAPGASFVVAMTAINHRTDPNGNPNSPVNLGAGVADFETFWPYMNRDTDVPDVPNLFHAYASATSGFDWMPGFNGSGLVIFKSKDFASLPVAKEPNTASSIQYKAIPVSAIIDGIDCVGNANITADKKRLPTTVDAGMTTTGGTYNSKSVRRKVKSVINGQTIFQDTNNSAQDFEINDWPSPRKWN